MKLMMRLLLLTALLFSSAAHAGKITIAAAADLKFALDEIATAFRQANPGETVDVIYGSSGKFHAQIQNDAPYDLYFSADIAYPQALHKAGLAASEVIPYAFGRIVLWSNSRDASKLTLNSLDATEFTRIAIANPRHAPYGKRAIEALQAAGMLQKIEAKLVYGENIAHAAQFVQTGNAEVGIIALALALSPELASKGSYWLIPDALHAPLEQGFIITKRAAGNTLARRFADHMRSPETRAIMSRYGFTLPRK